MLCVAFQFQLRIRIRIHLLAHRNLLWDILRLPSSARPICHSHTTTNTWREPATIRIAAYRSSQRYALRHASSPPVSHPPPRHLPFTLPSHLLLLFLLLQSSLSSSPYSSFSSPTPRPLLPCPHHLIIIFFLNISLSPSKLLLFLLICHPLPHYLPLLFLIISSCWQAHNSANSVHFL